MIRTGGRAASLAVAAGVSRGVYEGLRRIGGPRWERTNHAGRGVPLYAGPAVALGAAAGAGAVPGGGPAVLAVLAAGACGAYGDVRGDVPGDGDGDGDGRGDGRRGFRARLAALREGEVTAGAVRLFGIGAASLAAGALLKERPLDKVLAATVIAGTAHLVGLADGRPGRAGLVVLALGAPGLLRGPQAAAPMGAVAAVLGDDLAEETLLGGTGAHALGAAVGAAVAAGNGRFGLAVHAAGLVAAAVYGELAD
ncbi:hypothetical protein [Streptomyces showdoensis]|uniref:Uncharacterized protein n=1 Tax=Streptomyces showdoensis TaxID=68268 RepID=A0A2P2GK34_STREW|nr:hypothetical protein [Streptomyces showdoensis]KKZ71868.1 hypothetical protein VO63_21540 [Streptomyces showdoensis]